MSIEQVLFKDNHYRANVVGLLGINYKIASVDIRERFAISAEKQPLLISELISKPKISEAVVVNTCNRMEVVISYEPDSFPIVQDQIINLFQDYSGVNKKFFNKNFYQLSDTKAVGHLFRVASGLDSMIIGEPQVLGQLKQAYEIARVNGGTKALLNRLFHRAFSTAKSVRSKTAIGQNAVSVCYAARELAKQIFGDLSGLSLMILGAGETAELALKHFVAAGVREVYVANRTRDNALRIASATNATVLDLQAIGTFLPRADIIVGAATVENHSDALITVQMVEAARTARFGKMQFYIDLGIPRNIAPVVGDIEDVFLYNVDDLKAVVTKNIDSRMLEFRRAEIIIDDAVEKFVSWQERYQVDPTVREVFGHFDREKSEEIQKTIRSLRKAGMTESDLEKVRLAISVFGDALIAKLLHGPVEMARELPSTEEVNSFFKRCFLGYRKR